MLSATAERDGHLQHDPSVARFLDNERRRDAEPVAAQRAVSTLPNKILEGKKTSKIRAISHNFRL